METADRVLTVNDPSGKSAVRERKRLMPFVVESTGVSVFNIWGVTPNPTVQAVGEPSGALPPVSDTRPNEVAVFYFTVPSNIEVSDGGESTRFQEADDRPSLKECSDAHKRCGLVPS